MIVGIDAPGLNEYIGSFCEVCEEQGVTVYIDYAGEVTFRTLLPLWRRRPRPCMMRVWM